MIVRHFNGPEAATLLNAPSWKAFGVCALCAAIVVLSARIARADECRRGCNLEKRDCLEVARTMQLACKLDCRQTALPQELGSCMRGCNQQNRSDKRACKDLRADCQTVCGAPAEDPSVDGQCVAECASGLGVCAKEAAAAARACRKEQCKDLRGPDRAECIQGCAGDVEATSGMCVSAFLDCMSGCGAVPTTTTTTPPTTVSTPTTTVLSATTTMPSS